MMMIGAWRLTRSLTSLNGPGREYLSAILNTLDYMHARFLP